MTKRNVSRIVIPAVLILALGVTVSRLKFDELRHYSGTISWLWVTMVILTNVVVTFVEALRWKLFIRPIKPGVGIGSIFSAILVGVAGNTVMPMRLGDGVRAYYLSRKEGMGLTSSFSTVAMDYYVNSVVFIAVALLTVLLFHLPMSSRSRWFVLVSAIVLGAGAVLMLAVANRNVRRWFVRIIGATIAEKILDLGRCFKAMLSAGTLIVAFLISFVLWGLKVGMVLFMMKAFGLAPSIATALTVLVLSNIGIAVANTPANLGVFELTVIGALKLFGINIDLGVVFAVLLHIVEVVPMMVLGFTVLGVSGLRMRELMPGPDAAKNSNGSS